MGYRSHHIVIKKLIPSISEKTLGQAEIELEGFLCAGFPSLSLSDWPRPTFNDLLEGGSGIGIPSGSARELIVSYCGTRRSLIGAYLLAYISLERKEHLSARAREISFVGRMLSSEFSNGIIVIGQTNKDLRSFGVVSGRESDVFSYCLGVASGLDSSFIMPGKEKDGVVFPVAEFSEISRSAKKSNEIVHVSGWAFGRFLRKCFRDLACIMGRSEFENRFGAAGVKWRPRSVLGWK
jgi:hypothetical protein